MRQTKIWFLAGIFVMAFYAPSAHAQKMPAGMRIEVAESEGNNSEYSIFTYKDKDDEESFGYYLSLGRVTNLLSIIRDDITDATFEDIRETCVWLGSTYDEAMFTLDNILDIFDDEEGTVAEFKGRAVTKGERLGEPTTSTCTVQKKMLGGKRLLFVFVCGKRQAETYVTKAVVKELRAGMKIDKKLHPKQHR